MICEIWMERNVFFCNNDSEDPVFTLQRTLNMLFTLFEIAVMCYVYFTASIGDWHVYDLFTYTSLLSLSQYI